MLVTQQSEISQVIELIENDTKNNHDRACPLICEEIISSLLESDCEKVYVDLKKSFIEIKAHGQEYNIQDLINHDNNDESEIESEIRLNILTRYAEYIEYNYSDNLNYYRVLYQSEKLVNLSDEIYNFYSSSDKENLHPMSLIYYLAGNHKVLAIFTVLNKSIKHLAALSLPVFAANIIEAVSIYKAFFISPVMINILASITALTLNLICAWYDSKIYHRFTRGVEAGIKMSLIRKLQILSMKYHSNTQTGKTLSKLVSDVPYIKLLIYESLQDVLHMCIDIIFVIIVVLIKMPAMIIFYAFAVPGATLLVRMAVRPAAQSKTKWRKQTEKSNAAFSEMLSMESLTRSHGLQNTEYRNIFTKVKNVQTSANIHDYYQIRLNNLGYGTFQGFRLLCLCCSGYLAARGTISIGAVVLFQSLFDTVINSVQKVLDTMPQITQGYDSLASVNEILCDPDIEHNGTKHLTTPVRGEIEFRNVSFSYSPDQQKVLNDVSFRIPAGKAAAFVGGSGAGKSTILNLILGLYKIQSGKILIDGVDIDELEKNSYRRYAAVVPQNTVLFSGTLWDNLTCGLNYVTASQVINALKSVGLYELIQSHPDGLNREILEGGSNFSGGQRQKIAIARALLREPRIILFDEATSALDPENELKVLQAVESILGTCTVIMSAHRLNTLSRADLIYKIDNHGAKLYESFDELMKNAV